MAHTTQGANVPETVCLLCGLDILYDTELRPRVRGALRRIAEAGSRPVRFLFCRANVFTALCLDEAGAVPPRAFPGGGLPSRSSFPKTRRKFRRGKRLRCLPNSRGHAHPVPLDSANATGPAASAARRQHRPRGRRRSARPRAEEKARNTGGTTVPQAAGGHPCGRIHGGGVLGGGAERLDGRVHIF